MKATRWPALILIPLLIAALLIAGSGGGDGASSGPTSTLADGEVVEPGRAAVAMPVVPAVDAALSTWYCPVGLTAGVLPGDEPSDDTTTTTSAPAGEDIDDGEGDDEATPTEGGDGTGDEEELAPPREYTEAILEGTVLLLTNVAEEARTGTVTLMGTDGPVTSEAVEVAARSRFQADLADWVEDSAGPVAALVELDGGGVAAAVVVDGTHGSTAAPCAAQPSAAWYLPAAATTLDARAVLTLYNPFPDDAIVEIGLTDRTPPAGFEAFPVPAESVVSLELTDVITVRPQFATTVTARTGQVVAALVQQYDGSAESGQEGLAVVPGAPVPSETWFFPSGVWGETVFESYLLFNPGAVDAQVDVSVSLDDPELNGSVQPFEVTVPAGNFAVIGSGSDDWGRVPSGVGHSVSVRVQNDQPVVVAQRQSHVGEERPGITMALGAPLVATDWLVPTATLRDAASSLSLLNPSPLTLSRAAVVGFAEGATEELADVELPQAGRFVLRPDQDLSLEGRTGGRVTATEPVVVGSGFAFESDGRAFVLAVPMAGTTSSPDPVEAG